MSIISVINGACIIGCLNLIKLGTATFICQIANGFGKSIVSVGPVDIFNIQYNCGNHPRFLIAGRNGREFDIRCTDIKFCALIKAKSADFEQNENSIISSQNVAELKGKRIYFVIGLTGDSLAENNEIKDGKYAPEGSSIQPRYWPLVVSLLTIPSYLGED